LGCDLAEQWCPVVAQGLVTHEQAQVAARGLSTGDVGRRGADLVGEGVDLRGRSDVVGAAGEQV